MQFRVGPVLTPDQAPSNDQVAVLNPSLRLNEFQSSCLIINPHKARERRDVFWKIPFEQGIGYILAIILGIRVRSILPRPTVVGNLNHAVWMPFFEAGKGLQS